MALLPLMMVMLCHMTRFHLSRAGTRMLDPPSRATSWRYGYKTPRDVHDDATDCGGYQRQYLVNRGKCGICGDPFDEPRPRSHEAGGVMAPNPRPVRAYESGSYVTVVMETSSSLFGKFEFRICNVSHNMATPEQDCFDQNLLAIVEADYGTSFSIGHRQGIHVLNLQLPTSFTCQHCILQWTHKTGYMTNKDSCLACPGGTSKCFVCLGCGDQAWFVGCSDLVIYDKLQGRPPTLASRDGAGTSPESAPGTNTPGPHNGIMPPAGSQCVCPKLDPNDNLIHAALPYPGHSRLLNVTLTSNRDTCQLCCICLIRNNNFTNKHGTNSSFTDTNKTQKQENNKHGGSLSESLHLTPHPNFINTTKEAWPSVHTATTTIAGLSGHTPPSSPSTTQSQPHTSHTTQDLSAVRKDKNFNLSGPSTPHSRTTLQTETPHSRTTPQTETPQTNNQQSLQNKSLSSSATITATKQHIKPETNTKSVSLTGHTNSGHPADVSLTSTKGNGLTKLGKPSRKKFNHGTFRHSYHAFSSAIENSVSETAQPNSAMPSRSSSTSGPPGGSHSTSWTSGTMAPPGGNYWPSKIRNTFPSLNSRSVQEAVGDLYVGYSPGNANIEKSSEEILSHQLDMVPQHQPRMFQTWGPWGHKSRSGGRQHDPLQNSAGQSWVSRSNNRFLYETGVSDNNYNSYSGLTFMSLLEYLTNGEGFEI